MKNLLLFTTLAAFLFSGCSQDEDIKEDLKNTENSMLITGIAESISYSFTDANGRVESSIPEDINLLQILILNADDEIVYEQYHYNYNAYNEYYYDSAAHGGDDYLFENTIPDTLFIPQLPDGSYTVLAATTYMNYYSYNYETTGSEFAYPFIESYQVMDAPIFVGKATAEVTESTDALVEIDMSNISARVDLNVTNSNDDLQYGIEVSMQTGNNVLYDFKTESFMESTYDYDQYLYMWRDSYWKQPSFYFLPRELRDIRIVYNDYQSSFNMNFEFDIDPDLTMGVGDVFTLNIDLDELIDSGGAAGFNWEEINWNNVGEITVP